MNEEAGNRGLTSIIVPAFNNWQYTEQCLSCIRQFTDQPYELIVVNNGSTDETGEELKKMDDVILIENAENVGFPKACNQGMERAKGEQLVIVSNDVIVSHHWLTNLLQCLDQDPRHGAVGPVANNVSGVQHRAYDSRYANLPEFHEFARDHNRSDSAKWFYTLRLIGFCVMVRREVYASIGGFDERFGKGNFEDDDYSLRARRAGYRLVVAADTFVHHYGSVTYKQDPEYILLLQTNAKIFMDKWGVHPWTNFMPREDLAGLVPEGVKRVLDVGCAAGALGLTLKNRGVSFVAGIDRNASVAIDARTVLDEVWIGDAEEVMLPYPEHWFDAMVLADVLEYTGNPLTVLRHLSKYLKPSGSLVASLSNVSHVDTIFGLLTGRWVWQSIEHHHEEPLHFFTLQGIVQLFDQAGFRMEFTGMVQEVDPHKEPIVQELQKLNENLGNAIIGPTLQDQLSTKQYYARAVKR